MTTSIPPAPSPARCPPQSPYDQSLMQRLAVAQAFLDNKPVELSCKEYAAELRAARVRIDSPMASPSKASTSRSEPAIYLDKAQIEYTIDSGVFWRNRASRLLEAKQALSGENERLEAENVQLRLRITALETAASVPEKVTSKDSCKRRRSASSKTNPTDHIPASKRLCIEDNTPLMDELASCSIMETPQGQKANHALLVAVFGLQDQLKNMTLTEARQILANSIGRTTSALIRMTDNLPRPEDTSKYFQVIKGALGLLFHAVAEFDKSSGSCENGNIIFAMTKVFRTMLSKLWDYPVPWPVSECFRIRYNPQQCTRLRPRKLQGTQTRPSATVAKDKPLGFQEKNGLVRAFIAFIASHTSDSPTIAELAEGVLYLLLQRAGPLMYAISFDVACNTWSRNVEEQIRAANTQSCAPHATETKADRDARARVLMPLMKQALSAYLANPRSRQTNEREVHLPAGVDCDLLSREKFKIQHTLKQIIFPDDKSAAYGEGIKAAKDMLRMMEQEEKDMWSSQEDDAKLQHDGIWFVEDLWTLVGWDVMADYWPDYESSE